MKVGIIGPTKIDTFCRIRGLHKDYYHQAIEYLASRFAETGHSFFIVPDRGSSAHMFGQLYKQYGGKNLTSFVPESDKEFGTQWLDFSLSQHTHDTKTWRNTPSEIAGNCTILLCLGLSVGSVITLAYSKFYNVNKVYLIKEFCPPLPLEITHKLHCKWVGLQEVIKLISPYSV